MGRKRTELIRNCFRLLFVVEELGEGGLHAVLVASVDSRFDSERIKLSGKFDLHFFQWLEDERDPFANAGRESEDERLSLTGGEKDKDVVPLKHQRGGLKLLLT